MTKKWYKSRTLKVNAIMILGVVAQILTNTQIFDADIQVLILGAVNVGLRLITETKLVK